MDHVEAIEADVLCLPYADERFVAYIVLPDNEDSVGKTEAKLMQRPQWDYFMNDGFKKLPTQHVKVVVPKVDFRMALTMKTTMDKCGLGSLFDADASPLANMGPRRDLCISAYYQRTCVKFSSQGSLGTDTSVL